MLTAKTTKELEAVQLVKERAPPVVVKDQKYLNNVLNNGFNWNNKYRANDKNYVAYHQYHDKALPNIEKLKNEEDNDKKVLAKMRIQRLAETRAETLNRFQDRAQERKLIQLKSQQTQQEFTANELDRMIAPYERTLEKKAIAAKHSIYTDNKWNFLLEHDQKRAQLYVTQIGVKGEENLINHVHKKIKEEEKMEELREKSFREGRDQIRRTFAQQRKSNAETSMGRTLPKTLVLDDDEYLMGDHHPDKFITARSMNTIRTPEPTSLADLPEDRPSSVKNGKKMHLAVPKKRTFAPKDELERPEFKGMLIKHCNEGISEVVNPLVSALTSKSQMFSRINNNSKSVHRLDSQLGYSEQSSKLQTASTLNVLDKNIVTKSMNNLTHDSFYKNNGESLMPQTVRELYSESKSMAKRPQKPMARSHNDLDNIQELVAELDEFEHKNAPFITHNGFPRSDLIMANYQNSVTFRSKRGSLQDNQTSGGKLPLITSPRPMMMTSPRY